MPDWVVDVSLLPHLGEVQKCPKCGHDRDGAHLQFCTNAGELQQRGGDWLGFNKAIDPAVEHLHVTCKVCGFNWRERCVDASG